MDSAQYQASQLKVGFMFKFAVSTDESQSTVTLSLDDGEVIKPYVLNVNSTVLLIASLIQSLPFGVEIDYEAIISDPVHKCIADAKLGNLSREDLADNLRNLPVDQVSITKNNQKRPRGGVVEPQSERQASNHPVV